MSLILAAEWARQEFGEGSRPSRATYIRWIRAGTVPGRQVGQQFYVDMKKWNLAKESTGNELADSVLRKLQ